MRYHIAYYGLLAERRGLAAEEIESARSTPAEIYRDIDAEHRLGLSTADMRAAVNDEFVAWEHPLKDNDSIAFLPPMSGG